MFSAPLPPQGWKDLGQGVVNSIHLSSQFSPQGIMMRAQMSASVSNYIDNIPSMSAYEVGHDLGYGSEKIVEAVALSKGAGLGVNALKNVKYLRNISKGISLSKNGNVQFSYGFRNVKTNFQLRFERHSFNTNYGRLMFTTHINYGLNGGVKHIFLNLYKYFKYR